MPIQRLEKHARRIPGESVRAPIPPNKVHGKVPSRRTQVSPGRPDGVVANHCRRVAPLGELDVDLMGRVRANIGCGVVKQPEDDIRVQDIRARPE